MSTSDNTATNQRDVYARVTAQIINAIEQGVDTWRMPWHTSGRFAFSALTSLQRASFYTKSSEPDLHMDRASKLMRLYNEQAETMLKLKGKTGQQKVTVEHVHVHEGGQAIVGSVTAAQPKQVLDHAQPKQLEGGSNDKRNKTP